MAGEKEKLKDAATKALIRATKEIGVLGTKLFKEDQFRHIVLEELAKVKIFGKFSDNRFPKLVLEMPITPKNARTMSNRKTVDIVSLNDLKTYGGAGNLGSSTDHKLQNVQPLAIELKVNDNREKIASDVARAKKLVKTGVWSSTYKLAAVLVATESKHKPREVSSSKVLFGHIKNGKPEIYWISDSTTTQSTQEKWVKDFKSPSASSDSKLNAWKKAKKKKQKTFTWDGKSGLKISDYHINKSTKRLNQVKK
jgi:hypothetical protein